MADVQQKKTNIPSGRGDSLDQTKRDYATNTVLKPKDVNILSLRMKLVGAVFTTRRYQKVIGIQE